MAYNKGVVFGLIATCTDPKKLRTWIDNARREGAKEVESSAI